MMKRYSGFFISLSLTRPYSSLAHQQKVTSDTLLESFKLTPNKLERMQENVKGRGSILNFEYFKKLMLLHSQSPFPHDSVEFNELQNLCFQLPNETHPLTPIGDESHNKLIFEECSSRGSSLRGRTAAELMGGSGGLRQLRVNNVVLGAPGRTCYFLGDLARLENALSLYTLQYLTRSRDRHGAGYQYVTVPDILPSNLVEACGFPVGGVRTQIYGVVNDREDNHQLPGHESISGKGYCLAGTGEMGLAGYCATIIKTLSDSSSRIQGLPSSLPWRLCTLSRCFRREVPSQEAAMYRVHQFNKVEMFVLCEPSQSEEMFNEIMHIQRKLFKGLDLTFRCMEMSSQELGLPAYRKVDNEAWMAGEGNYGEISSASNCTDYQSQRLGLVNSDGTYLHTMNGTACALTRTLKALLETHQNEKGEVDVPAALLPYMSGTTVLQHRHSPANPIWLKYIKPISED